MSTNASTAVGGAVAAQAIMIADAIKASGTIVQVEPQELLMVLELNHEPLVVRSSTKFFGVKYQYLTSYRGLAFYAKTKTQLTLPAHCQIIESKKIWVPSGH